MFAIGCLGLAWGISNFVRGIAVDEFWDLEARLLQFENFSGTAATRILGSAVAVWAVATLILSERFCCWKYPSPMQPYAPEQLTSTICTFSPSRLAPRGILSCSPREFIWLAG